MIRVIAALILAILGSAAPARACTTQASSTFCADGWVTQPTSSRDAAGQDPGGLADAAPETAPAFGEDGIYVEGAVSIDDPPIKADGQL